MDGTGTLRLVFIGASKFGLKILNECYENIDVEIVGVVTAPRKFKISYSKSGVENVLHADIESYAAEKGIECLRLNGSMTSDGIYDVIRMWRPQGFLVAGWYHMIPKSWRGLAPAYGLHASLLPKYAGGAPLVWAIINGETTTGITLFEMDDGVDTGPIIAQASYHIKPHDDIASVYREVEELGLELVQNNIVKAMKNEVLPLPQSDNGRQVWPQRSPKDGLIKFPICSRELLNFIRAQTKPYPGAFFMAKKKKITVWKAEYSNQVGPTGEIESRNGELILFCSDKSAVKILHASLNDMSTSLTDLIKLAELNEI